jgi:hypothetical protein
VAAAETKAAMAAAAMMPACGPAAFVWFAMSMHTQFSVLKDISLDRSFRTITQDISFDNLVAWKPTEYQWIAYFKPMGWASKLGVVGQLSQPRLLASPTGFGEMTDVVEMIEAWEATEQRKAA